MFLPNEASSSLPVPFLTAGRDSELNDSIFGQVSLCWLKLRIHFHAIQLQFLYRSSKSREELAQQPDQHHRVVSPTATTVPRWWSGELKYDILFPSIFNCLPKALILLQHRYYLERLYICASFFTNKTLLNNTTGCARIESCPCSYFFDWTYTVFCQCTKAPMLKLARARECKCLAPVNKFLCTNHSSEIFWLDSYSCKS